MYLIHWPTSDRNFCLFKKLLHYLRGGGHGGFRPVVTPAPIYQGGTPRKMVAGIC